MNIPFSVKTRAGTHRGELFPCDVSNEIWLAMPMDLKANMLGSMIFCDMPVESDIEGERVTDLEIGDVAYWPNASALCLFFGPTPLSGEDGKPVSPYPVVKIGRMLGDCSGLENTGDGTTISFSKDL